MLNSVSDGNYAVERGVCLCGAKLLKFLGSLLIPV